MTPSVAKRLLHSSQKCRLLGWLISLKARPRLVLAFVPVSVGIEPSCEKELGFDEDKAATAAIAEVILASEDWAVDND